MSMYLQEFLNIDCEKMNIVEKKIEFRCEWRVKFSFVAVYNVSQE